MLTVCDVLLHLELHVGLALCSPAVLRYHFSRRKEVFSLYFELLALHFLVSGVHNSFSDIGFRLRDALYYIGFRFLILYIVSLGSLEHILPVFFLFEPKFTRKSGYFTLILPLFFVAIMSCVVLTFSLALDSRFSSIRNCLASFESIT